MKRLISSSALAGALILSLTQNTLASDINVGMTTALSGPAQALGTNVRLGVESYFSKVNAAGGINGNQIKLIALDDGYEPAKAGSNMRTLIDQNKVVSVIGNVGTPTAIVTVPIANEKKVPLVGAFTGAGVLRQSPPDRYIINYRASYAEETASMIDGLLKKGIKPEEIAFFTQNDGYGDAGYKGAISALKKQGVLHADKLTHGRYTRNTLNVEDGLSTLLDADIEPKAIIMVGAYAPCAKFIKLAKEDLPEAVFLNVSFVGSVALKKALGKDAEGVIITQVVPHFESNLPAVKSYREDIKTYNADASFGFASLEGYLAAKIYVQGLQKIKGDITAETIVTGLESITNSDIGIGTLINYGLEDHQASHNVWPTIIKNGAFQSLSWDSLNLK